MRKMKSAAGKIIGSHKHKYEHYSILCAGRVQVDLDGEQREVIGPDVIVVPAGVQHLVTALTDIVWFCVHGTTETENIDEALIK
jgi:quercetin dioxygenase-like cupin family protein